MHKTRPEALEFAGELTDWLDSELPDAPGHLQVVVAPAYTSLESLVEANAPCGVFAQNMHQADNGAFTGEISAQMLVDIGVHGVVLGHSERRQYFAETNEALAEKVSVALNHGLYTMLCVGETLEQRQSGQLEQVVGEQLRVALNGVDVQRALSRLSVAYEPVWAIGTGETASPEQAQDAHAFIRTILTELLGDEAANRIPILYGGSVKPTNAPELLTQPDIDGALIGGAALEVESFTGIIAAGADRARSGVGRVGV
jgi:triosephosphate isomerase